MKWLSFTWRRESWRVFWRQRGVYIPIILALIAVAASWFVVAMTPVQPGESRVVRYSIYVGTNWIADPWVSYMVPALATLFVIIDIALTYLTARKSVVLQYVWLWAAALTSLGFLWLTLLLAWFNI